MAELIVFIKIVVAPVIVLYFYGHIPRGYGVVGIAFDGGYFTILKS